MAEIKTLDALREVIPAPKAIGAAKVLYYLDDQALAFLARSPFVLLATSGADGTLEVSPKGDEPGFVLVEDERTLLLPDRPGNNLAFGLTNIIANPAVALIFLLPRAGETLRVSGTATILDDPDLCQGLSARGKPAKLVLRIKIARAYFHCARAVLRARLWEPESWGEPFDVSFGKILANADPARAALIDKDVNAAYKHGL